MDNNLISSIITGVASSLITAMIIYWIRSYRKKTLRDARELLIMDQAKLEAMQTDARELVRRSFQSIFTLLFFLFSALFIAGIEKLFFSLSLETLAFRLLEPFFYFTGAALSIKCSNRYESLRDMKKTAEDFKRKIQEIDSKLK